MRKEDTITVGLVQERLEAIYRSESRHILATLIRLIGDFELAEDALHDAFAAALEQWVSDGVPANPRAWLVSAGRFKAIDSLRRRARFDRSLSHLAEQLEADTRDPAEKLDEGVEDDQLRLIFTCCHPALSQDARMAGKVWRKYGALDYKEGVGDDISTKWGVPFSRTVRPKRGELVVFSFIVFKSRGHRDRVNAKVMKDLFMNDPKNKDKAMPFDVKRMVYGGFKVIVDT